MGPRFRHLGLDPRARRRFRLSPKLLGLSFHLGELSTSDVRIIASGNNSPPRSEDKQNLESYVNSKVLLVAGSILSALCLSSPYFVFVRYIDKNRWLWRLLLYVFLDLLLLALSFKLLMDGFSAFD